MVWDRTETPVGSSCTKPSVVPVSARATHPHELHIHQLLLTTAMTLDSENNVHSTMDHKPHARCPTCHFTGPQQMPTQSFDVCATCNPISDSTQPQTVALLSAHELHMLEIAVIPFYTSTDGSVKGSQTDAVSSTWGICFRVSESVHISWRG